jgi:hypothetical protein
MNEPPERLDLLEFEDEGAVRLGLELPIPPFGKATIIAEDDTADSEELLRTLAGSWTILWPAMYKDLCNAMENLDIELECDVSDCTAYASKTQPGYFMADKSDIYLSLEFEGDSPDWDYFIKDARIVHFQPVF